MRPSIFLASRGISSFFIVKFGVLLILSNTRSARTLVSTQWVGAVAMERIRAGMFIGLTPTLSMTSSTVTYGLTYFGGNNVEDHEIKKAVEAVMSLRPQPKPAWESAEQRIANKRRHDDWLFAQELARVEAGKPTAYNVDYRKKEHQSHSGQLTFLAPQVEPER